ncbi:MAG: PQQ-binding-like beta-propeller repeat protein, partial [Planctomycetes bacterium]|nr:PQQ-binding-like beta-propeller repeat protein [Planctomycetota bacterium]
MTSQQFSLRLRNAAAAITVSFVLIFMVAVLCTPAIAGDWPTHRFDGRRSAVTTENIGPELYQQWVFHSPHTPKPAWPGPAEEMPRMHSDSTCNVVVADGKVYFASATAGKVNCIDLASGKANWSFFTDGPVRFTPSVYNGRVYFGSDDGYVYCLDAKSGEPVWKYRPGPSAEKVIGNGQMISLWPVRTSVLVDDRQVLFAAGVFPYEGIYVCALDPSDGSVIWRNDTVGDRAHELDFGGMSPHGYLVASGDIVYVPSGRALPAAFSRKDGKFLFFTRVIGKHGGAWTMLAGDKLLAGVDMSGSPQKAFFNASTGSSTKNSISRIPAIDMVASGELFYALTEDGIQQVSQEDNKGRWQYKRKDLSTLVLAGYTLLAGGKDFVVAVDTETGSEMWQRDISGTAVGLAVADGRLIVSTDSGKIHCFADRKNNTPDELRSDPLPDVFPKDSLTPLYKKMARQIADDSGITKGYALVLDCGTGRLAYELAKNTDLQIVGLENDPDKLRLAREKLDSAGLLGDRIVVQPWQLDDLPEYFANLIVSDSMLISGKTGVSKQQAHRLLRPYGGTAYWGRRSISDKFVRGKLEGAGEWTQQFANAQNTACSNDDLVAGPLGVLWYGEPGPQGMIERHADAASPVSVEGRMFVQGEHRIMAVDAYNGTVLWDRELPGAARMLAKADSGNLVANADGLYLAARAKCYRLDPATGDTVRIYTMPPSQDKMPKRWGYVSVQGNILYGSAAEAMDNDYGSIVDVLVENGKWKDKEQIPEDYISVYEMTVKKYPVPDEDFLRELERSGGLWKPMRPRPRGGEFTIKKAVTENVTVSDQVFALDTETGKLLWSHRGNRIADTTITIGDGKLFLTRLDASPQQKKLALKEQIRLASDGKYLSRTDITQQLDSNKKRLDAIGEGASGNQTRKFKYMADSLQAELEHREGTLNFDDYDIRTV